MSILPLVSSPVPFPPSTFGPRLHIGTNTTNEEHHEKKDRNGRTIHTWLFHELDLNNICPAKTDQGFNLTISIYEIIQTINFNKNMSVILGWILMLNVFRPDANHYLSNLRCNLFPTLPTTNSHTHTHTLAMIQNHYKSHPKSIIGRVGMMINLQEHIWILPTSLEKSGNLSVPQTSSPSIPHTWRFWVFVNPAADPAPRPSCCLPALKAVASSKLQGAQEPKESAETGNQWKVQVNFQGIVGCNPPPNIPLWIFMGFSFPRMMCVENAMNTMGNTQLSLEIFLET